MGQRIPCSPWLVDLPIKANHGWLAGKLRKRNKKNHFWCWCYGIAKVKSLVSLGQRFRGCTNAAMLPTVECRDPVFSRARLWLPCMRAVAGWAGMCAKFSTGALPPLLGWSVVGGCGAAQIRAATHWGNVPPGCHAQPEAIQQQQRTDLPLAGWGWVGLCVRGAIHTPISRHPTFVPFPLLHTLPCLPYPTPHTPAPSGQEWCGGIDETGRGCATPGQHAPWPPGEGGDQDGVPGTKRRFLGSTGVFWSWLLHHWIPLLESYPLVPAPGPAATGRPHKPQKGARRSPPLPSPSPLPLLLPFFPSSLLFFPSPSPSLLSLSPTHTQPCYNE